MLESLHFFQHQGDNPNIAAALSILGDIQSAQGNLTQALHYYKEALQLDKNMGNTRNIGKHLIGLANVARVQGQLVDAACLLGVAETCIRPQLDLHATRREAYQAMQKYLRTHLDEKDFSQAWSTGHNTPLEQAFTTLPPLISLDLTNPTSTLQQDASI